MERPRSGLGPCGFGALKNLSGAAASSHSLIRPGNVELSCSPPFEAAVRSHSVDDTGELPLSRAAANSKSNRRISTFRRARTICCGWSPHTADRPTTPIKSLMHPCRRLISRIATNSQG